MRVPACCLPGTCPQRDSNPRYGLERAVTWAASRWGPGLSVERVLLLLDDAPLEPAHDEEARDGEEHRDDAADQ
jgi:hypothetical protein